MSKPKNVDEMTAEQRAAFREFLREGVEEGMEPTDAEKTPPDASGR